MASVFLFLTKLVLIFVILKTVDATLNCEVNETMGIILPTNLSQSSNFNCQSELSLTNVAWYLLMLKGFSKPLDDKQWTAFNCTEGKSNVSDSIFCVHGPLHPPNISGDDNLEAGVTTNLTCTIYNVYPAPNIEWFLGPEKITMNASLHTTLDNSSSLFSATSLLSFTPRSEYYEQNLTCIVLPSVENVWPPVNASIQLHVLNNSGQSDEILRVESASSSSLYISWDLKHNNITTTDISLGYCPNSTMDSDNVTTSEDLTCPDYKEVPVLNGTSYNLTGLEPFQWYKVTLLVGGNTVAWVIASTAPPLPEYYGVFMTFTPQKERLRITRIPIENRTLPSDLCFVVIQTRDQIKHNCSNGCCKPGSKFTIENITGFGLVSSGRGFYSLPSPLAPMILNSTRGILDMPHVTIVMGAVLGAAVFILLSSVAILLFLNFICKGIACLGKKGGYGEDDETLVRVIHKDNTRKVDEDGLVYVDIVHDHAHPDDAPPIRTEEPTVYASLDRNAMGSRKKDDDGLVYIEVSHDNAHSPDAPPIQTEKPIVYATLDMEAMATRKEKEEKGEEGGVKDEEDGVENEIGDVKEEKDGIKEDNEGVMGETDGVKEKKEDDKKAPEDPSPATTKQPNYENITLLSNDDGLAIPMETRL